MKRKILIFVILLRKNSRQNQSTLSAPLKKVGKTSANTAEKVAQSP